MRGIFAIPPIKIGGYAQSCPTDKFLSENIDYQNLILEK